MNKWSPIPEDDLRGLINIALSQMNAPQRRLWEVIKIDPVKWKEKSYGEMGGGFWVVAILGRTVIWYNDIEEGFNISSWTLYGLIDEYRCNQDELQWTIQNVLNLLSESATSSRR